MAVGTPAGPELFTVREIARAAGVAVDEVRTRLETGEAPGVRSRLVDFNRAVELVRGLRSGAEGRVSERRLFAPPPQTGRRRGVPWAASGALHAGMLAVVVVATSLGLRSEPKPQRVREPARLVFLATPGPGGGGGGGGLRQRLPPPRAQLKGASRLRSPVTLTRNVARPREAARRVEPPPPIPAPDPRPAPPETRPPAPAPPVVAPVVSAPGDVVDLPGVVIDAAPGAPSRGPGAEDGTGIGRGTGNGEGAGAGIGEGTIAGTGGGPYRPGSGISPPSLEREVKPRYTEEGRRRGVEGGVVLEVVIRADGTVGAIRVLHGLGSGLDGQALEAVRQWRFSPARRFGTPVDVLVEVAVEFRLR